MKLKELAEIGKIIGDDEIEVCGLTCSSSKVKSGELFFALVGKRDGHEFVGDAIKSGANVIVTERQLDIDTTQVVVPSTREAVSLFARNYFGKPDTKLKIIAITGTNGKTTTTFFVSSILKCAGKNVAIVGTNGIFYNDKKIAPMLTTPDPIEMYSYLSTFVAEGVEYVVMEASAHAIYYNKLFGMDIAVKAFTNFSQDHLDFFGSLKAYRDCKKSFFNNGDNFVVNIDDELGREIAFNSQSNLLTFGCYNPADVFAIDWNFDVNGTRFVLNCLDNLADVSLTFPGKFNMYNALCAISICYQLEVPLKTILDGLKCLQGVDGRFEIVRKGGVTAIIDFAHTEDGIDNVLSTISQFASGDIITVFGAGGDRDKDKRSKMGRVASLYSNKIIVTSDNPRSEQPIDIIRQIEKGIIDNDFDDYTLIENRKDAIEKAVMLAHDGDIIAILGKGAENYQEIDGVKYEMSDKKMVLHALEELR